MNRTLKNVLRVVGIAAGVGAAIWAMRDKLLPAPNIPEEPPSRFRTGPEEAAPAKTGGDDLTEVKGIGPVYAARLTQAGIDTFATLTDAGAEVVASAAGVSAQTAGDWIERAAAHV